MDTSIVQVSSSREVPVASARRSAPTGSNLSALAGVSIGTVSRALSVRNQLRPETRDRVGAAARDLGWQLNIFARSLTADRSFTVGLITSDSFGRSSSR